MYIKVVRGGIPGRAVVGATARGALNILKITVSFAPG